MNLWLGIYRHKYGIDPLFIRCSREPSTRDFEYAFPHICFKLDREDEYLTVYCVEPESIVDMP